MMLFPEIILLIFPSERRHRERQEDGEARRRNWAERFGRDNGADIGSRQYRERDMEPEIGKPRGNVREGERGGGGGGE